MQWTIVGTRGDMMYADMTGEEAATIRRYIETFVASCKKHYPGLNKNVLRSLNKMTETLPGSGVLRYECLKLLLRWCITEGRHLQDERRDNARKLWRALFSGRLPDFYRYNAVTEEYEEYFSDYLDWCRAQAAPSQVQPAPAA